MIIHWAKFINLNLLKAEVTAKNIPHPFKWNGCKKKKKKIVGDVTRNVKKK